MISQLEAKPSWLDFVPGFKLILHYDRKDFPHDLMASLVVTLVLIPSAIAYSDLAKCPPVAGLYAALGGMLVFGIFTSSKHVIAGPDAAVALMVGAAVGTLADGNAAHAIAISTWLALITGALLLLAAWFKLGAAADLLANPVMLGFMNGAALVIVISQIGKLFGVAITEDNSLLRIKEWLSLLPKTHVLTLTIGIAFLGILAALRLWFRRIPGTIVVFILALLAGRLFDFHSMGMAVIGTVDTSLPDPVPPGLSLNDAARLLVSAIGLAFLIFPEGIVLGRSVAAKHGYPINADRELMALGASNVAAGLLRGFAVGSSQSRTLLNNATGGKTQMVSLLASVLLVGFLVFLAPWMASLPSVAIAAILTFTGFTLVDRVAVKRLRLMSRVDASISITTSLGVIGLGVLPGVLLGVFLSLTRLLGQVARPQDALLGRIDNTKSFHEVNDEEASHPIPGCVIYRFYGPLIFANIRYFIERLGGIILNEKTPVQRVILDARAIPEIDVTAAEELRAYIDKLNQKGIRFMTAKVNRPLREAATQLGLQEGFTDETCFHHLSEAVAAFESTLPGSSSS